MNCTQANKISIVNFLSRNGYVPIIRGNSYWYSLREEKTPSTKVDIRINRWFDFGQNVGGKLVDLVSYYFTQNTKKALDMIGDTSCILTSNVVCNNTGGEIIIKKVVEIEHQALKNYLNERRIFDFFQDKIKQIHYTIGTREYFALGWQNDSGGWELRNKLFKGCILKKDITTIIGEVDNDILDIWEGMFNFLSYLQYNEQPHKVIVLNSVANVNKAIIGIEKYKKVNLYLDNDKTGRQATKRLQDVSTGTIDYSSIYADFNDYNDYLLHNDTMKINHI